MQQGPLSKTAQLECCEYLLVYFMSICVQKDSLLWYTQYKKLTIQTVSDFH